MSNLIESNLTSEIVADNIEAGVRDTSVFPGLDLLYRTRRADKAVHCRSLDKSPDDMIAWISWNNGVVFTDKNTIGGAPKALSISDNMIGTIYRNTAHKVLLLETNLSSLSATAAVKSNIEGRIFCTYPGFLRRSSAWVKKSVVDRAF